MLNCRFKVRFSAALAALWQKNGGRKMGFLAAKEHKALQNWNRRRRSLESVIALVPALMPFGNSIPRRQDGRAAGTSDMRRAWSLSDSILLRSRPIASHFFVFKAALVAA